jgi:hypothetical protein
MPGRTATKKTTTKRRVVAKGAKKAGKRAAPVKRSIVKRKTASKRSVKRTASTSTPKRRTRRFADGEKLIKNDNGRVVSAAKSALGSSSPNIVTFALRRYAIELLENAGRLHPSMSSVSDLKERMKLTSAKWPQGKHNAALIAKTFAALKVANADLLAKIKEPGQRAYLEKVIKQKTSAFEPVDV